MLERRLDRILHEPWRLADYMEDLVEFEEMVEVLCGKKVQLVVD